MKIWLAGKMSGLTFDQMNAWRINATRLLRIASDNKIQTINPCDYYNFKMSPNTYTENEVMEFDLHMVKASDLILVNLENPNSIGTAIELYYAHDILNKPVIGYGLNETNLCHPLNETNLCHPWMKLCLTKECKTLEQAIDYIVNFYLPNLQ